MKGRNSMKQNRAVLCQRLGKICEELVLNKREKEVEVFKKAMEDADNENREVSITFARGRVIMRAKDVWNVAGIEPDFIIRGDYEVSCGNDDVNDTIIIKCGDGSLEFMVC